MKKVLKDPLTVLFVVCAVSVAVCSGIEKNFVGVVWPLIAACYAIIATLYRFGNEECWQHLSSQIEENTFLRMENAKLREALTKLTNKEEKQL